MFDIYSLIYTYVIALFGVSGGQARPERPQYTKAPRARLAITAKSKPPQGKSDDFTMVFTDVQGSELGLSTKIISIIYILCIMIFM